MALTGYRRLDAVSLAGLVADGAVSPAEALEAALEAIAQDNPAVNAVVEVAHDAAQAQLGAGLPDGPLRGVPVLLKDLGCPSMGTRTTAGSALFAGVAPWAHDSRFAARLKAAGAVIVGRTNSCEFGISLTAEPAAYGPTRNPYDLARAAGGSSGGSAAAVACGMVPLAHGTDGCGSLRVPAAHCGLVGLKPSRARVSFAPDFGESWAGMTSMGGLARSVRDAALLLDVVAGSEPGDPYAVAPPQRPFSAEVGAPVERLRIGIVTAAPNGVEVHADCLAAVSAAGRLCQDLGHAVEPATLGFDLEEAVGHLVPIWSAQLWALVEPRYRALGRAPDGWGMEPISWRLASLAHSFGAVDHLAAIRYLHRAGRDLAAALAGFDVLLSPVAAAPPQPLGALPTDHDDLGAYLHQLFAQFPFTVQSNITGRPAVSLPMGRTADGLPLGVQFAADLGQEGLLLRLAAQIESAAPWA